MSQNNIGSKFNYQMNDEAAINSDVDEAPRAKQSHFLFVLSSSRSDGNTAQLARYAASFLDSNVQQTWVSLQELDLPEFVDQRHQGNGHYTMPSGNALELLQATLNATDVVLVTPLYWYSLPTLAKRYLDHWSGWMRVAGLQFRERMAGKRLWNITVLSDEDTSYASPLVSSLELTAGYLQMKWQGSLLGYGNRPGDIMQHEPSLISASQYFLQA